MKEIKLPQMGQSVEEATITQWLKKEGDKVALGEPIFTIQTDKAEIECEATESGTLRKILVKEDVEVPVLTVVALVGDPDEPLPDTAGAAAPKATATPAPEAPAPAQTATPTATVAAAAAAGKQFVSPRARTAAKRLDVDSGQVAGSGPGGRVIEADILAYHEAQESVASTPSARRIARMEGLDLRTVPGTGPSGRVVKEDVAQALGQRGAGEAPAAPKAPPAAVGVPGERIPLTPMRRIIAERMVQSKFSAPHYYITVEVDMKASTAFRSGLGDFKPSFNDLVMRAATRAIQDFPIVNSRWHGDAIEVMADVNMGFAVALPAGLIVPVVRQIQKKSLQDISRECKALAEKARTGKLTKDDYSDNTFTISNLGAFGIDQFTAVINQPDSAILAVGQVKDRVVVIDGGIQIRPIMKLTLSGDHRVLDGAVAAQYMGRLKQILEAADY